MIHVVFLCTEISKRSQMAEGCARHHGAGVLTAYSAGSSPKGEVNPIALEAMVEKGLDLGSHRSKSTEELPTTQFDVVITMGCGDQCPWLHGASKEDWGLQDPRDLGPEGYREVRDEIERRVLDLVERLR